VVKGWAVPLMRALVISCRYVVACIWEIDLSGSLCMMACMVISIRMPQLVLSVAGCVGALAWDRV